MSKKNYIIIGIIIAVVVLGLIAANSAGVFRGSSSAVPEQNIDSQSNSQETPDNQSGTSAQESQMILFYGDTCPHCQALEEWILENKISDSISFERKEVYNNEDNRNLLIEKAGTCGIADNIGVPFLWTGSDCIVGDEPIEQFFQEKLNITTNENAK